MSCEISILKSFIVDWHIVLFCMLLFIIIMQTPVTIYLYYMLYKERTDSVFQERIRLACSSFVHRSYKDDNLIRNDYCRERSLSEI